MMKLIGVGMLALAAACVGCVATQARPLDRRVTIAENITGDVFVSDVRCAKGTGDHLTFQANVVNLTSREQWVDWKVVWLDPAGLEIDSIVSTWNSAAIAPKDIRGLKGTAPHPAAADMRFYLRRTVR
ncbi:MAG: YcfL family protein [Kiritimatiellia bacterium]